MVPMAGPIPRGNKRSSLRMQMKINPRLTFSIYIALLISLFHHAILLSQDSIFNFTGEAILLPDSLVQYDMTYSLTYEKSLWSTLDLPIQEQDTLKIELYDVKGNKVYDKNFGLTEIGDYRLKFTDVDTSGIFFVRIRMGQKTATRRILFKPERKPSSEIIECLPKGPTYIDGNWQRNYIQDYTPAIILHPESQQVRDTTEHNVVMQLRNGEFNISWHILQGNKADKRIFKGCYEVVADTVKFYKLIDNELWQEFMYSCSQDSLSFSYVPQTIDKGSGLKAAPLHQSPFGISLVLVGKYQRIVE